ncbi:MAG: prepilin peptidase, partial [Lentisphaeraceae bacterium]|nr:prepilin peptidase [Lentisphaeraceae bacterium]
MNDSHSEKLFWRRGVIRQAPKWSWKNKLRAPFCRLSFLHKKSVCSFLRQADLVLALADKITSLSNEQLAIELTEHAASFARFRETPQQRLMAAALIRERSFRILGMRHHRVQIAAGLALAQGYICEMATGEGKTLTSVIAIIMLAWRQRGVHVFTANDYLVKRDASEMSGLYKFCGLSTAYLEAQQTAHQRAHAYRQDIVYATQKDIAADFLKDCLQLKHSANSYESINPQSKIQLLNSKGLAYAIIDEIDSLLIDEADTPLILSGDSNSGINTKDFEFAIRVAKQLSENLHFHILNSGNRSQIELKDLGKKLIRKNCRAHSGIWNAPQRRAELVLTALKALHLFQKGKEYIIDEGEIVIIDQQTGRLMPDRTCRRGLQQMVQAKEKLEIQGQKKTHARITFQDFFRLYEGLCGLSGTAREAAVEFTATYSLKPIHIPLHQPGNRQILPCRLFNTTEKQLIFVIEQIRLKLKLGQAVLVAVNSVIQSQQVAEVFKKEGLKFALLNASEHRREADIISLAGQVGQLTICTNMAGRGTDIKLHPTVKANGGLHVISLCAKESIRVERQLAGRCSRQGDPGSFHKIL